MKDIGSADAAAGGGIWAGAGLGFTGFGHYYPRDLVYNARLARDAEGGAVDQAVIGSVEVRSRHVAAEDETIDFMAARAAAAALDRAGRAPAEVDLLVLGNWSERQLVPELAPQVALRLGASRALAFDVCGACTGFVHGVQTAAALLAAHPSWRVAVVACSEYFSRRVRPGSKGTLVVGDAAGAAVLEKREPDAGRGLIDSLLCSAGESAEAVTVRPPLGWIKSKPELVELGVASTTAVASRLLERNDLKIDQIDWFVPHPGTSPIHAAVRERLAIAPERFITTFETRANTGSASIPTAVSEYLEKGVFHRGDLCLTPAVGSGWFYGGLLFEL
jgi:3-oxoacyl-[acyl-carrier-protein] synthase-3